MSTNNEFKISPSVGTGEGLKAAGVYVDLINGLQKNLADLRRTNIIYAAIAVLAVGGLVTVTPLRKIVPFFYEVDSSTGRISVSGTVAQELNVSDANIAYFIRLWVTRVVTINAATLKENLPNAYKWTRGSAQAELDDWTEKTDKTASRLSKNPGLTREIVGIPTVSFSEGRSIAFVDFVWAEKVNGVEVDRRRKLMTLEFGLLSPTITAKDAKEALQSTDNPLGLAITHFTLNDQISR